MGERRRGPDTGARSFPGAGAVRDRPPETASPRSTERRQPAPARLEASATRSGPVPGRPRQPRNRRSGDRLEPPVTVEDRACHATEGEAIKKCNDCITSIYTCSPIRGGEGDADPAGRGGARRGTDRTSRRPGTTRRHRAGSRPCSPAAISVGRWDGGFALLGGQPRRGVTGTLSISRALPSHAAASARASSAIGASTGRSVSRSTTAT